MYGVGTVGEEASETSVTRAMIKTRLGTPLGRYPREPAKPGLPELVAVST